MNRTRTAGVALLIAMAAGSLAPAQAAAPASTTTLELSTAQSEYGQQSVTATARVSTMSGAGDGDVYFTVDGTTRKTSLDSTGSVRFVLPRDARVGEHSVSAAFVPRLPSQEPSTSPTVTWTVTQVRTRLQVRVTGRGERVRTSVVGTAAGDYGTLPTGKVRVKVRRDGSARWTKVVPRLSTTGSFTAALGRLTGGRYRLQVTYTGDSQHLRERYVARFVVRGR